MSFITPRVTSITAVGETVLDISDFTHIGIYNEGAAFSNATNKVLLGIETESNFLLAKAITTAPSDNEGILEENLGYKHLAVSKVGTAGTILIVGFVPKVTNF